MGLLALGSIVVPARPAQAASATTPGFALDGTAVTSPFDAGLGAVGIEVDVVLTVINKGPAGSLLLLATATASPQPGDRPSYPVTTSRGLAVEAFTSDPHDPEPTCSGASLAPGKSCDVDLSFVPVQVGTHSATVVLGTAARPLDFALTDDGDEGYYVAGSEGQETFFDTYDAARGDTLQPGFEEQGPRALNAPVVGTASTQTGDGYYQVSSDGGVFAFGDATFHGSAGGQHLNQPVVGMATHEATTFLGGGIDGYWLIASDGGIFSYGDAKFYGSTGSEPLNKPIVGMAATPDGGGYWLVASDGGIFSYGDAKFYGSVAGLRLAQPIVAMAATPDGGGYWLVASDGGIFSYGDAKFYGSVAGLRLAQPIVAMAGDPDGGGYWLEAADAGSFAEGDAPYIQVGYRTNGDNLAGIGEFGAPVPPLARSAGRAGSARATSAAVTAADTAPGRSLSWHGLSWHGLSWHGAGVRTRI
jgi:hypothetical protein